MTERSIFMDALEKATAAERAAYLDTACAGDAALRQRVEALLASHEQAGDFLGKPAPERLAEGLADSEELGETQLEVPPDVKESEALEFLTPADRPGVLGRLGHYEVLDVVGRGGMGIVLRAFDRTLHRVVAIKVMAAQLASNGTARQRFIREARAAAAVSHDHVVTIHAVEEGPTPYMVMQYVPGVSLQQRLDREGPLPLQEVLRIGMQTASGLAAAHSQGLVHRDIKPANILLENGVQRVKITDFGMARAASDAGLTQSGVVTGTPQYMAPEQARGAAVDARTDLFSLGSVLYAMCTGRPPFRASGSMAVLKRVCEETPRPIRETNPEVPDWLTAVIEKLHAKDPAERFQSAAEVAELLNGRLAQLQHPAPPPAPAVKPAKGPPAGRGRRRVLVAAVCVLLLLGGLSLAEATGVTNLRATVIRVFTPDGTLVVETDDPGVKVTVEGDGGLVITGAGLEEIRLRPGSYRLRADRDGKPVPLERELVSISRGGREVVKVKLEAAAAPAPAKVETGAFVLLGSGKERRFETLADAVQGARDGDTIEVRGDGPFVTRPITIHKAALTIRAGEGFRPVIKADPDEQGKELLLTRAPLVLEGLDFQWTDAKALDQTDRSSRRLVFASGAPSLYVANCRFLMNCREGPHRGMQCIGTWDTPICHLRNCQLLVGGYGTIFGNSLGVGSKPHGEAIIVNCLNVGLGLSMNLNHAEPMKTVLKHNTFLGPSWPSVSLYLGNKIDAPPLGEKDPRPLQIEASANILEGPVQFAQFASYLAKENALSTQEAERLLTQLIGWRESRNLYLLPEESDLLRLTVETPPGQYNRLPPTAPTRTLDDWKSFWGMAELDSERGQAEFKDSDLLAKARQSPEQLIPEDFRLRADSAGYRAGKDGKDLGADVDLVGPGPAYERWKKTPEYQQWLRDTNQFRAEAKPEPKAFALLGAKGREVGKYDTLAEAVRVAHAGDTVEVRGHGPFVSDPISIQGTALTIRAGEGFRPVIKLSPEGLQRELPLLSTNASLVLEGLELYRAPPSDPGSGKKAVIRSDNAPLRAANCRFRSPVWVYSPVGVFRNCEFLSEAGGVAGRHGPGARILVENCLSRTKGAAVFSDPEDPALQDLSVQIKRSTFSCPQAPLWLALRSPLPAPPDRPPALKPIRFEVSGSVFDCRSVLGFSQTRGFLDKSAPLEPAAAEDALRRLLEWRGERNLFAAGSTSVHWSADAKQQPQHGPKNLEEWKQFWGAAEADSLEKPVRFEGGNQLSRADVALDQLTPRNFRLSDDSAGKGAGKEGGDLGADVDLVGPGEAYDRWKKTPDYQQWLKDTGQFRAEAPAPEPKAFVVLTGKGDVVNKFDTLADAVLGANDGDTVEVRGNGPFVLKPVQIGGLALTIRAGAGFRPVLRIVPDKPDADLISTSGRLVLEGLEIRDVPKGRMPDHPYSMLFSTGDALHVANCRLLQEKPSQTALHLIMAHSSIHLRNCEFYTPSRAIANAGNEVPLHVSMENCAGLGQGSGTYVHHAHATNPITAVYRRNTLVLSRLVDLGFSIAPDSPAPAGPKEAKRVRFEASSNVFDIRDATLHVEQLDPYRANTKWEQADDVVKVFAPIVSWRDQGNVYSPGEHSIVWHSDRGEYLRLVPPTRKDWERFWGLADTGSVEGGIRLRGGNLLAKMTAAGAESITPENFRLRDDSAGYRAGKDGGDLGADVDLVGPGAAYERWKKTPEYRQWLKDTGQSAAQSP